MIDTCLRDIVWNLMKIDCDNERIETKLGVLAWKFPQIAEFCYLARLNRPLHGNEIDKLVESFGYEYRSPIVSIYNSFNGLKLFNEGFYIFGLWLNVNDPYGQSIQNLPFDIMRINNFERPRYAPKGIIVVSGLKIGDDIIYDGIDNSGRIVTGRFAVSEEILQIYDDLSIWIVDRINGSARSFYERYGEMMPVDLQKNTINLL